MNSGMQSLAVAFVTSAGTAKPRVSRARTDRLSCVSSK